MRDYFIAVILVILLTFAPNPVWGGRTGNGTSDQMKTASGGLFNGFSGNPQGSLGFIFSLIAFPPSGGSPGPGCGSHCGEIVNVGQNHQDTNGCTTVSGACIDIFVCHPTTCTNSEICEDVTTPNVGEGEACWAMSTGGTHQYVFLINQIGTSMQMYKDGVLQTVLATGQNGNPGGVNYGNHPVCVLTDCVTAGSPLNFVNGTISDLAIWNVTLTANEITTLANCVPPNRVEPDHVVYWPLYGTDSTEPNYNVFRAGQSNLAPRPLTVTGTTAVPNFVAGCPAGGAFAQ